mgnify:CR=1 FL=1
MATPIDSTSIKVRTPTQPSQKVSFIGLLENLNFEPVTPKAKVVVNSRTGTVVIGGDVRISPAAVAHGSLSVKIREDTKLLSEGTGTVVGQSATVSGTGATTAQDTQIDVDEQPARAFVFDPGIELQTLVSSSKNAVCIHSLTNSKARKGNGSFLFTEESWVPSLNQ